jgi:diacylglycerol kinase
VADWENTELPHASRSLWQSMRFAVDGLCHALYWERNMRIHFAIAAGLFIFELIVRPAPALVAWSVFTAALVIAAELQNTAIERLTDLSAGTRWHVLAKAAKDLAAGMVLTLACGAVAVGLFLLWATWPWQWRLFSGIHPMGALLSGLSLLLLCAISVRALLYKPRPPVPPVRLHAKRP